MSLPLLAAITCAYAAITLSEILKGEHAQAIIYGGYAFANIGLMMVMVMK